MELKRKKTLTVMIKIQEYRDGNYKKSECLSVYQTTARKMKSLIESAIKAQASVSSK